MCSRFFFVHITFKSSKAKNGDVHVELYIYILDLKHEKLLLVLQKNEQFHISSIIFIPDSFICLFSKRKKKNKNKRELKYDVCHCQKKDSKSLCYDTVKTQGVGSWIKICLCGRRLNVTISE